MSKSYGVDQAIKNNRIKPDIPNYETFENYIENAYENFNPPPEYVALIG